MSGRIFISVPVESVLEKIKSGELSLKNDIGRKDRRILVSKPEFREVLLNSDISPQLQEALHDQSNLTLEQIQNIFQNCTNVWSSITHMFQYSSEFLLEHGAKMDLWNIEGQDNITPEFVKKFGSKIDLRSVVNTRQRKGDFDLYKGLNIIRFVNLNRDSFEANMSKQRILDIIHEVTYIELTAEETERVSTKIDELFSTPVNAELLKKLYDTGEGRHNTSEIISYWNNNFEPNDQTFNTWQEFYEFSRHHHATALPNVTFRDFYAKDIIEALAADNSTEITA